MNQQPEKNIPASCKINNMKDSYILGYRGTVRHILSGTGGKGIKKGINYKTGLALLMIVSMLQTIAGCKTAETAVEAENIQETDIETVDAMVEEQRPAVSTTYGTTQSAPRLKPGLMIQLQVLVAGNKEIDEPNKRISNSGEISLPLVGNVDVRGLTLDEFSDKLTELYSDYYVQPQIVVQFVQDQTSELISPWGFVTVLGRVRSPGRVSIPPTQDLTVSGAIQQAGGLDTSAKQTAIRITRPGANGDASEQFETNLKEVGSRGNAADDFILKSGDIIFVPEMMF